MAVDDIAEIKLRTSRACAIVVCEPWDRKQNPATGYEAKFSLPFALALIFSRGTAGIADFTDVACANPSVKVLLPMVA